MIQAAGPSRLRRGAAVVGGYALLTAVMTWPFVNYSNFATASYGGDARLIIWTLAWDNHAVLTGQPLFQSNLFFPAAESLRYNEHLFGLSLLTLPWAAAGASPVLAYNVTWWLAFLLNGVAAFVWVSRFVRNRLAVFVGSLAFACSFYVMLHAHGHLHLIWLWPLPTSALLLEKWFDDPRAWRMGLWLVVVLMGASASWYLAAMVILVNGVMALILLTRRRGIDAVPAPRVWVRRGAQLAVAVIVLAATLYPLARHYVGMRSTSVEAASYSADLASYLIPPQNTVIGRWWMNTVDARPRSPYGEQTLFAGWLALLLAAVGLVVLARGHGTVPRAWCFPALVLAGFLLSLGPSPDVLGGSTLAPFAWLEPLPGFAGIRAPARFAAVTMLGVAGLAAVGADALSRGAGRLGRGILVALIPLMLAEWFVVGFPGGRPVVEHVPAIYSLPEVRSARSLASLPEYRDAPDWFNGADYLYYSTAHWRPIVNGFGRSEPPNHADVVRRVREFAVNPAAVHDIGLQYVVVHAARFADGARELLEQARTCDRCRLAAHIDSDYLFEILP